jgi:hypothetical protein
MSGLFQRLIQGFPERHAPGKNSFATDARSLREWIAHLPLANPSAAGRLLIHALRETNQLRIEPSQRLEALELLRPRIAYIVAYLDRQILVDALPLPPAKQQLAQLAQDFELELAIGYTAAVYDFCAPAGAVPFLRARGVALALTRAVQHRGGVLLHAYLRYQTPPVGAWRSLHDLFRFAVAVRLDDKPVPEPLQGEMQTSVRLAYQHALLFALCNPYRFTPRENREIQELTRVFAGYCELREGRAPSGAIAVRTDSDQSPGYLPEEREAPGEGLWALEINGLLRFVEGQLATLPPGVEKTQFRLRGGTPIEAEVTFVARVLGGLDNSVARGAQRLAAGHRLDIRVGLNDVHFALAGKQDFETFLRKTRGTALLLERDRASLPGGAGARPRRYCAKVLDQSLGGYRLLWEKAEGLRIRVGEIIGLAPPAEDEEEAQDWMVGVIRWLRWDAEGALDVGVELLAHRAIAAAVRALDRHDMPRAPLRGIVLKRGELGEAAGPDPLLVANSFDRDARQVEITQAGDPFEWPLEPRVETLVVRAIQDLGGGYLCVEAGAAAVDAMDEAQDRRDESRIDPRSAGMAGR